MLYRYRTDTGTFSEEKVRSLHLGCRYHGFDRFISALHQGWLLHRKRDLLVFICAILFSLHILVIDYFSPKADGVKMSCIQFLVCGILSGIPALLLEHPDMSSILAAWMPILYAGVMSCGVAYTLQIVGQRGMNPTVASLILSLESCISVLAGWVILGQSLSTRKFWAASSCSERSSWHSFRKNGKLTETYLNKALFIL